MFTYGYADPITLNLKMLNIDDFDQSDPLKPEIRPP